MWLVLMIDVAKIRNILQFLFYLPQKMQIRGKKRFVFREIRSKIRDLSFFQP